MRTVPGPVLEFPAKLILEVVVTLGVAFFTARMARGFVRYPAIWSVSAVAASFLIHRIVDLLAGSAFRPELTYASSSRQLLGMVLPFSGSVFVFLAAPLIVYRLVPHLPYHLRAQTNAAHRTPSRSRPP